MLTQKGLLVTIVLDSFLDLGSYVFLMFLMHASVLCDWIEIVRSEMTKRYQVFVIVYGGSRIRYFVGSQIQLTSVSYYVYVTYYVLSQFINSLRSQYFILPCWFFSGISYLEVY